MLEIKKNYFPLQVLEEEEEEEKEGGGAGERLLEAGVPGQAASPILKLTCLPRPSYMCRVSSTAASRGGGMSGNVPRLAVHVRQLWRDG